MTSEFVTLQADEVLNGAYRRKGLKTTVVNTSLILIGSEFSRIVFTHDDHFHDFRSANASPIINMLKLSYYQTTMAASPHSAINECNFS